MNSELIESTQELLAKWDDAATPASGTSVHNGGGFALDNWRLIRADLRAIVDNLADANARIKAALEALHNRDEPFPTMRAVDILSAPAADAHPEPPTEVTSESLARLIGDSGAYGKSGWLPEYDGADWDFVRLGDRIAADAILEAFNVTTKEQS